MDAGKYSVHESKTIENRAAGIADTVQRGLGMLPQQAICED